MSITKEEVEEILSKVKDGNKVLEYIEEHYCHCNDDEHHHDKDGHCHCHDDEPHHEHHCDCGCEDEHDNEWKELDPKGYKSKLSVEDWEKLLQNKELFNEDSLIILKRIRHVAAPTSSAELADMFGYGAMFYSMELEKLSDKLAKKLEIKNLEKDEHWAILMNGWEGQYEEKIYALRPELYEALGNIDLSKVPLRMN